MNTRNPNEDSDYDPLLHIYDEDEYDPLLHIYDAPSPPPPPKATWVSVANQGYFSKPIKMDLYPQDVDEMMNAWVASLSPSPSSQG